MFLILFSLPDIHFPLIITSLSRSFPSLFCSFFSPLQFRLSSLSVIYPALTPIFLLTSFFRLSSLFSFTSPFFRFSLFSYPQLHFLSFTSLRSTLFLSSFSNLFSYWFLFPFLPFPSIFCPWLCSCLYLLPFFSLFCALLPKLTSIYRPFFLSLQCTLSTLREKSLEIAPYFPLFSPSLPFSFSSTLVSNEANLHESA